MLVVSKEKEKLGVTFKFSGIINDLIMRLCEWQKNKVLWISLTVDAENV